MPKVTDRATICWTDKDGQQISEEVVTYEIDEDVEEIAEEAKSDDSSILTVDMSQTMQTEENPIHQAMVALILDDMLEKFSILRCSSQGDHYPMGIKYPEYKTLEERYGQVIQYAEDQYSESKKRYSDLNMIYSVIYKALESMGKTGTYAPLTEATRIMKKTDEDDERLILEEEESRIEEEEIRKQLKTLRAELEAKYNEKLEKLRLLEVAHENAIAYGKLEYKYLQNWEAARIHQAKVIQERIENDYRDVISTNSTKIELENRIHGELVKFFDENAEELTNETSYWMYRYETEIEARESELLKLRMDRESQMEKHIQLKARYERQKEFIDYWEGVKEERRISAEQRALEDNAARIIQDWWRRTMKRLGIGRYRKGKKGKGKGKGKGKKK